MLEVSGYGDIRTLHRGQRSLVLRGRRLSDDLPVVIKTAVAEFPSSADLRRLRHEFEMGQSAASGVARGHVVRHLALEPIGSSLALVLEDFGGTSLRRFAGGPSHLPLTTFLELALQLARAVDGLHQASLAHLDINPDNILYNPATGALRLCDLSSAVELGQEAGLQPRSFRGTPAYASPETTLRTDWRVDARADLYSLGVTFFQLLTGQLPFGTGDHLETFHRHLAAAPPSPRALRPDLPEALAGVLLRLLTKNPDERYRGASGLASDLQVCRERIVSGNAAPFEIGADDHSPHFSLPRQVYGREQELADLVKAFQRAADGGRAYAIVSGEAGAGKSTLIERLRGPVLARGGQFCSGKFEALKSNAPYAAFAAALRGLAQSLLVRPSAELRRCRDKLMAAVGPNGQHLLQLAPELELLLGPQAPAPPLEPDQAQAGFRHTIVDALIALSGPERPLVVFLDDMQWADLASIALAGELVVDERFKHAMLICSQRTGEGATGHSLHELFQKMLESGSLVELEVGALDQVQVERLIGDAIGRGSEVTRPLARLISRKTRGNPFFVEQFLKMLHAEGLLYFDPPSRSWQADLAACEAQGSTDNALDLMLRRLHRLEADTQRTLRYAACFGGEFDLPTLAALLNANHGRVDAAIAEALREELVGPFLAASPKPGSTAVYRFQHDQVRQAAYLLTASEERPALHLRIGRTLLARCSSDERIERVFEILHQLLQGVSLVADGQERRQIAELCWHGGRRAKAANAYDAARDYLRAGLDLLGESSWQASYELTLSLYQDHAEASYLGGHVADMEASCASVLEHAKTLVDQLPAQQLRVISYIARNDLPAAIGLARSVLAKLGRRLPSQPSQTSVAVRVAKTAWRLRGESAESLVGRPRAEEPLALAAMQFLSLVSTPAYLTSPNLFPILICDMLTLTLRHGTSPWAADAFLGWGAIQIAGFGATARGRDIGSAAPRLVEALGAAAAARRGRTQATYNLLIRHWTEPLRATIEPLRQSIRHALEHGDLSSASIAAVTHSYHMLMAGCPLSEVEEAALEHDKLLGRLGQKRFRQDVRRTLQLVHCLQGVAKDPKRLSGELFDEEANLQASVEAGDRAALASLHYERALLAFVYGDAPAALKACVQSASYIDSVLATIYPPLLAFLSALVRLSLIERDGRYAQLDEVKRSLARLEKWAKFAPANHAHRVQLIRAEIHRVRGDFASAGREYERAIELAAQSGYLHEQAMALECAARFYAATRRARLAATTALASRNAWLAWGASDKAARLEREFAAMVSDPRSFTPLLLPAPRESQPAALDIESVVKASQAILGEIRLPQLVRRLLALAIENTGAQRGFLLLNSDVQLRIEAGSDVDDPKAFDSSSTWRVKTDTSEFVPSSVLDYVVRTKEPIVLADAPNDALFANDPYVQRRRPLSVLCLPLVAQGKLGAVVYLENNRMRGAFTVERLQVLGVLSALAAISLDNARLYEDVAQAHAWQVRVSEAQARFVPSEFLRSLQRASIVDVALGDSLRKEMSILFSDVRGFTTLVESMPPQEHIGFINDYLGHMEPAIIQNGGFVDSYLGDGIMALFEGTPDSALHAAIAMSHGLLRFNQGRRQSGRAPVQMGVGISSGPLTLGTIGGPGRIKCGVLGDPVNLAARIESLTKRFQSFLLISHETCDRLRAPASFELRRVAHVRVKGKVTPIELYEVLDAEPNARREGKRRTLGRFGEAMQAYSAGRFAEAARLFDACLAAYDDDGAARHLAARCREYEKNPPAVWDGVDTLSEK